jgi:hypothetical protein
MKKLITLFSLLLLIGCAKDLEFDELYLEEIPENLVIEKEAGIKLESRFANSEVRMNVKINNAGVFAIKVVDMKNQIISKEIVKGVVGDNLFKVYINTLPLSSYRLELYCDDEKVGVEVINLIE